MSQAPNRTTSGGQPSSGQSAIRTIVTERRNTAYNDDPENMDMPEFVRTGSYYRTELRGTEYRVLQASDVRRQVQQAPMQRNAEGAYPRRYYNNPPEPLQAQPPYEEFPIVPTPRDGNAPRNFHDGQKPGPVRAFYNNSDRRVFDVGYKDESRPPRGPRRGNHLESNYSLAEYVPAPTYTDLTPNNGRN